jgi:hypothetical protein
LSKLGRESNRIDTLKSCKYKKKINAGRTRIFRFLPGAPYSFVIATLMLFFMINASPLAAFDYLEHSYLTDRACLQAQRLLAQEIEQRPDDYDLLAKYVALSLFCPAQWERPYCLNGYKQAVGGLILPDGPPSESGDYSITLGDYAALPDHISRFGPVAGFPRALGDGLVSRTFEWLADPPGGAGGVIGDIAEDACETDSLVFWNKIEEATENYFVVAEEAGGLPTLPKRMLQTNRRAVPPQGPFDPDGAYSFDNPHYLDLILRNHNHFGTLAHSTWQGFHEAARTMAATACEDLLAFEDGEYSDLAEEIPAFENIDWSDLETGERNRRGCALLAELVKRRTYFWFKHAAPELTDPAAGLQRLFYATERERVERAELVLGKIVANVISLVLEGSGLHFMQDSMAGGHMRLNRAARGQNEARYDHDLDGLAGVAASVVTQAGETRFVAFGDGFLLGPWVLNPIECNGLSRPLDELTREDATACLLSFQRGVIVSATTASLLHWALGGDGEDAERPPTAVANCEQGGAQAFICKYLPIFPTGPSSEVRETTARRVGAPAELPVPPPPFNYQSILISNAGDLRGEKTQFGVRLTFLHELDSLAGWMTSYNVGVFHTVTRAGEELSGEFAYMFHWRWAARFLINAGPYAFAGLRGFDGSPDGFAGLGPNVGISLLPEGWIKAPLEFGLHYRVPVRLVESGRSMTFDSVDIEAHWLELTLGLAFLR